MKKLIQVFGDTLQALELLGMLLVVVIGPFVWMWRLGASNHLFLFSAVVMVWLLSLGMIAYEVRRKKVTAVSLGIVLTWLVALVLALGNYP